MTVNAVQFTEPMPVTNAACCSDPKVQCPKCAAAALLANGHAPNYSAAGLGSFPPGYVVEGVDDDEPLMMPRTFGDLLDGNSRSSAPDTGEQVVINVEDSDVLEGDLDGILVMPSCHELLVNEARQREAAVAKERNRHRTSGTAAPVRNYSVEHSDLDGDDDILVPPSSMLV